MKGELTSNELKAITHHAYQKNRTYRNAPWPWNDPYVGALAMSYGHAMTVHKAQGGEWNHVLLNTWQHEQGRDLRVIYTGLTRAKEQCYVAN